MELQIQTSYRACSGLRLSLNMRLSLRDRGEDQVDPHLTRERGDRPARDHQVKKGLLQRITCPAEEVGSTVAHRESMKVAMVHLHLITMDPMTMTANSIDHHQVTNMVQHRRPTSIRHVTVQEIMLRHLTVSTTLARVDLIVSIALLHHYLQAISTSLTPRPLIRIGHTEDPDVLSITTAHLQTTMNDRIMVHLRHTMKVVAKITTKTTIKTTTTTPSPLNYARTLMHHGNVRPNNP